MIETTARVLAVEGEYARVICERTASCTGCYSQSACGLRSLTQISPMTTVIDVVLSMPVEVGQRVRIGIPKQRLTQIAWLLYGLPLSMLLCGLFMSYSYQPQSEHWLVFAAVVGLATGFYLASKINIYLNQRLYSPRLLGILP